MTAHKEATRPRLIGSMAGRAGTSLRKGQAELVETLLPAIAVPIDGELGSERLFGDDRPLHLEIGFGGGEHLAYRADLLPDHGFIGCEPFLNRSPRPWAMSATSDWPTSASIWATRSMCFIACPTGR